MPARACIIPVHYQALLILILVITKIPGVLHAFEEDMSRTLISQMLSALPPLDHLPGNASALSDILNGAFLN